MRVLALAGAGCGLLLALLPAGCGRESAAPDRPDRLAGGTVATMAERELEAENPQLTTGTLRCPDLDLVVGAAVRCLRTTEMGEGRVVKVAGTVSVTSLAAGGRLHVRMDDRAQEFGLTGAHLAAAVRRQYAQQLHVRPRRVECPYLRGRVGTRVVCRVEAAGSRHDVDVLVTAVDPAHYGTTYVARPRGPAS